MVFYILSLSNYFVVKFYSCINAFQVKFNVSWERPFSFRLYVWYMKLKTSIGSQLLKDILFHKRIMNTRLRAENQVFWTYGTGTGPINQQNSSSDDPLKIRITWLIHGLNAWWTSVTCLPENLKKQKYIWCLLFI